MECGAIASEGPSTIAKVQHKKQNFCVSVHNGQIVMYCVTSLMLQMATAAFNSLACKSKLNINCFECH